MDDLLQIVINGIDAATGGYAFPPLPPSRFVSGLAGTSPQPDAAEVRLRNRAAQGSQRELARLRESIAQLRQQTEGLAPGDPLRALLAQLEAELLRRQHLGVRAGIDARELRQAGWGIICATDEPEETLEALAPLLDWRREQAGPLFRCYTGAHGYRSTDPREGKTRFLLRNGAAAAGLVAPERVPYYLLIIGDAARIPFEFQHQLDIQYAVGRLHLDSPAAYARYARAVVAMEQQRGAAPQLALFGPAHEGDPATALSRRDLIAPLHDALVGTAGWDCQLLCDDDATKVRLCQLLRGPAPALLFTATHGLQLQCGSGQQRDLQGALLCQDWPGPGHPPPQPDQYFAAGDIPPEADLRGTVWFSFACFSAGTPRLDSFSGARSQAAQPLATEPFVAALPRQLLAHPGGPALAVIGHVDRAWGYSFSWPGGAAGAHTAALEDVLRQLMSGSRLGAALEPLNQRYAELASLLCDELADRHNGKRTAAAELAMLWLAAYDARGYLLLGDPAAYIRAG